MKTSFYLSRGIAVEVVILSVALLGGAGWFGVREIKHSIAQHEQDKAAQELDKRQAVADAAAKAAAEEREKAALAQAKAEEARKEERKQQVATGRAIQRASIEGATMAAQLPGEIDSVRSLLSDRFVEIDKASLQLFGAPERAEIDMWKQVAHDALEGKAEALAKLADQKTQIDKLTGELKEAQDARQRAETDAKEADKKASVAQQKFDTAYAQSKNAVREILKAVANGDSMSSLAMGLKLVLFAVGGFWLLGLVLKIFSFGAPSGGPLSSALNLAANTVHSVLAPMSVLAETNAKRETEKLVQSAGSFITDVRQSLPKDVEEKVTNLLDVALSPEHQEKIRTAHLAVKGN